MHGSNQKYSKLEFCASRNFVAERPADGKFTSCCRKGNVKLPEPIDIDGNPILYPDFLRELLSNPNNPDYRHFRDMIRSYNSAVSFASMGTKIVEFPGGGPYVFKVHGQVYHRTSHVRTLNAEPRLLNCTLWTARKQQNFEGIIQLTSNVVHKYLISTKQRKWQYEYPVINAGKLTQQWLIDSYLQVEANNLNYIRNNQRRAEFYQGLADHIDNVTHDEDKEGTISSEVRRAAQYTCARVKQSECSSTPLKKGKRIKTKSVEITNRNKNNSQKTPSLVPTIDQVYRFNEIPEAFERTKAGHLRGKIVVEMLAITGTLVFLK
ncbi:uncharacterized protein CBL_20531 [Carabus blaptoides fortunei]